MLDDLKRLFGHGGVYLLGNVLNRIGAFLLLPLYTTYLSVGEYGILEVLYATVAVLSVVCAAGLSHTTLRFYFDQSTDEARNAVVTTNLMLVTLLCCSGAFMVHLFADRLSAALFDSAAYSHAISVCLAIMVFEMTTEVGFAYLRALEKSGLYVWLSFSRLLLQLAMSVHLVANLKLGIDGVLYANLLSAILGWLVVGGFILYKCRLSFRRDLVQPMFRYSLPMAVGGLLGAVSINIDRLMMKEFLSIESVGLFALATKFSMILAFVISEPFSRAYGPFRFSILEKPNAEAIQILAMKCLVAVTCLFALGIALFTPEVLAAFAGSEFHASGIYVPALLLCGIVGAAGYCLETGILAKKKTILLLAATAIATACKILLNLALLPTLLIHGATIALLVTAILQAGIVNVFSQRLMPIRFGFPRLFGFCLLGIACYMPAIIFQPDSVASSLLFKGALAIVFALLIIRLDADIRRVLFVALDNIPFGGRGVR
jgi:O-antigen/teichoic acid export membrane protein